MSHIARWLTVLGASALLSACFISDAPLIAPADADYPIADGTRFAVWKLDDKGERKRETPAHAVVTRDGANYVYTEPGEKPITGLMDDMGGGAYIVLFHDEDHPGQSIYGLLQKSGDNWRSHGITCPDFAKLAKAHGKSLADFHTADDRGNCAFSNHDDLKAAMELEARYAAPNEEYVAE